MTDISNDVMEFLDLIDLPNAASDSLELQYDEAVIEIPQHIDCIDLTLTDEKTDCGVENNEINNGQQMSDEITKPQLLEEDVEMPIPDLSQSLDCCLGIMVSQNTESFVSNALGNENVKDNNQDRNLHKVVKCQLKPNRRKLKMKATELADCIDLTAVEEITCHGHGESNTCIDQLPSVVINAKELKRDIKTTIHKLLKEKTVIDLTLPDEESHDNKNDNTTCPPNLSNENCALGHNVQELLPKLSPNMDFVDVMASPRTVIFKSDDVAATTLLIESPTNDVMIRVRNLSSMQELNLLQKQENPSLPDINTAVQTVPSPQSQQFPSRTIIKRPPFMYTKPLHAVEGGFVNLTNIRLPLDVEVILGLGPKFTSVDMPTISDYIEDQRQRKPNKSQLSHKDPSLFLEEYLKQTYIDLKRALKLQPTRYNNNLIKTLESVELFLNEHPEVRILQSEKGKNIVLAEDNDYNLEMDVWMDICLREGTYQEITDSNYLKKWHSECFSKYQFLHRELLHNRQAANAAGRPEPYPSDIQKLLDECNQPNMPLPFMYGVVKFHKERKMISPMFNTRSWYSYGLEQIICHVLATSEGPHHSIGNLRSITRTASDIRNTPVNDNCSFVKVHIKDMYTSMWHADIIRVVRSLVDTAAFRNSSSISPDLFVRLLEVRLLDMEIFFYRGKVYRQLRGLPHGACDAQILTSIMLCFQLAFQKHSLLPTPRLAKIYKLDDELLFYMPDNYIHSFIASLENFTQLEVSVEVEKKFYSEGLQQFCGQLVKGTVSFLDIDILRCGQQFLTSVRDPLIESGDKMPKTSLRNVPRKWRNFIIQAHLRRILERVSNPFLLKELSHMEQQFRDFIFPNVLRYLINRYINIYEKEMRNLRRPYSLNPMCNFGNLPERILILKEFLCNNYTPTLAAPNNKDRRKRKHLSNNKNWQSKRLKSSLGQSNSGQS